jgi:type I restriction enzyme, R subunit
VDRHGRARRGTTEQGRDARHVPRYAGSLGDEAYTSKQLDRDFVNPDQIRTVIRTFRDKLPEIFPGRNEVPKTLIFAKTDSHADDIIQIVRQEFAEGNEFCKKVTYQADEDPKSVVSSLLPTIF